MEVQKGAYNSHIDGKYLAFMFLKESIIGLLWWKIALPLSKSMIIVRDMLTFTMPLLNFFKQWQHLGLSTNGG